MTLFLPKINEGCQGQSRTKRLSSLTGGWKSSYYSPLPVEGEIFLLTFPFIDPLPVEGEIFLLTFPFIDQAIAVRREKALNHIGR
jgi:hypothetical protein